MVRYYLGIDGGQTHIEAVLTNGRKVVARGSGGPSHIQAQSMQQVFSNSLDQALERFPHLGDVVAVGVGVSGLGIPGKKESIEVTIKKRFPNAKIFIENDAVVAHWGATLGKDGVSVLAGTGTIAYGTYNGRSCRLGGFGYLFGDEGGGVWIGIQAIRRVLRSAEGRDESTSLTRVLQSYFQVKNVKEIPGLIYRENTVNVKQVAELAKMVIQEAIEGDLISEQIVYQAGIHLGSMTTHLLRELKVPVNERFPIYKLGGVWRSPSIIHLTYEQFVLHQYSKVIWKDPLGSPAEGAVLMALTRYANNQGAVP